MSALSPIQLCLDTSLSANRQKLWKEAFPSSWLINTHPDNSPGTQPSLVVIAADHWSEALTERAKQAVENRTAPVMVAISQDCSVSGTRSLISQGVWNVVNSDDPDALVTAVQECAERLAKVELALGSKLVRNHLVGTSPAWLMFLRELIWASKYSSASMLLNGETGTGKELLARLVHTLDERDDKGELVVVDCTTLSNDLAASELFGHERGSFTGAQTQRVGAAALANGGTLFLDEVGELSLPVQAQLLRLLQEGTYKTVGGNKWQRTDFRLICATHRDLKESVSKGHFRQDLYFRISGWTAMVPPLRQRADDIPLIADHFLREFGCPHGINSSVTDALMDHEFDGNVRELRQLMLQTAVKHCGKTPVSLGDLPLWWHQQNAPVDATGGEGRSLTSVSPISGGGQDHHLSDPDEEHSTPSSHQHDPISQWVKDGLGLREITQRAGDLAIKEALQLERHQVGKAARRLGVTERAIQLRRAQRPDGAQ